MLVCRVLHLFLLLGFGGVVVGYSIIGTFLGIVFRLGGTGDIVLGIFDALDDVATSNGGEVVEGECGDEHGGS